MTYRLAMEEAKLKRSNKRFINQELQKLFPEYTIESIKGVKNKKGQYASYSQRKYGSWKEKLSCPERLNQRILKKWRRL